jgi:hypothetical protein
MNSRLIAVALLTVASIAILALLIMPVVHVPYVVVHGPMTALLAHRSAALFNALMGAGASLVVASLFALRDLRTISKRGSTTFELSSPLTHLSCSLRC